VSWEREGDLYDERSAKKKSRRNRESDASRAKKNSRSRHEQGLFLRGVKKGRDGETGKSGNSTLGEWESPAKKRKGAGTFLLEV